MSACSRTPKVLLAVTGGIAAYKAIEVLRGLQKVGFDVMVMMSEAAGEFIAPRSFAVLSKHPVATELFSDEKSCIPHIELSSWADLILVVPATANILAKMAHGIADDLVSSTLLATDGPVMVAPAMNTRMWEHPATRENLEILRRRGVEIITPSTGRLACGDTGEGKLAAVEDIVAGAELILARYLRDQSMAGLTVTVTAGPTHEAIDPVRYIANASSGKTGFALARKCLELGARVYLVAGPCNLQTPYGAQRVDVVSAREMYDATLSCAADSQIVICAAAVADYTPTVTADHKLKKAFERLDTLELTETKDILKTLCSSKDGRVIIGFAAETNDVLTGALDKLKSKGADLIVANNVAAADSAFGSDTRAICLVDKDGISEFPALPLDEMAELIIEAILELYADV